ncbi:hypothetical protein K470DRAFT_261408 [Piedraia hortae CBS 480.64]|uniref:Uncharacterized protein n=1 Tax=Piedraia hortae CBS 480.64 TaxID=1314780 RepID=A0A6A7CCI1_9PEZI|nr:hypothetical protein K470DRAFT_261408 [Piedraia hortae CBS 480.64]
MWVHDEVTASCAGRDETMEARVRNFIASRWKNIGTMAMYLAAILDPSLQKDWRPTLNPEGLRAVMAWLDVRYLTDRPQMYGKLMRFVNNQILYNDEFLRAAAACMSPLFWWKMHFASKISELVQDMLSTTSTSTS